jgi:hypothetical protein
MHRLAKIVLAILLMAAVMVPPRIHAMAMMQMSHHAPMAAHEHKATVPLNAAEADDACHPGGDTRHPLSAVELSHALCLVACACLPATSGPEEMRRLSIPGERRMPGSATNHALTSPDGPFRPPRLLS